MKVIKGLEKLNVHFPNPVVTIGNFDGVHLGHQKIFKKVLTSAHGGGTPIAITFDPHPLKALHPERDLKLLTPLEERIELIKKIGIEVLVCITFTREFSRIEPDDFIRKILVEKLKATRIVVGHNYRFGKMKRGSTELLRRHGRRLGFRVSVVRSMLIGNHSVSSSRIRQLLTWGRVSEASVLLGRAYSIHGRVIRGAGRGSRLLRVPTANIATYHELVPKEGVYAARVKLGSKVYDGVANIGKNPTFGGIEMSYEVHIFNFDGNLLKRNVRVYFIERLRGEITFPDAGSLREQIQRDMEQAKLILKDNRVNIDP
jgi:riboflavin kinase/FMN adenylyltransferase